METRAGGAASRTDALARMEATLETWRSSADGRCAFLECYAVMTRSTLDAVAGDEFLDRRWVGELLERFAGAYFRALDAYEQGRVTPGPWVVAFDAAREADRPVLQHLLLGINAHINYDLVAVLGDLLADEWGGADEAARRRRMEDFDRVNTVIARTVDRVQESVVEERSAALGLVDQLLGPVDEWIATRMLTRWRTRVWADAERVLDAPDREERRRILTKVERTAEHRARRILLRSWAS